MTSQKIKQVTFQQIQKINSWSKIYHLFFKTALALTITSGLSYLFGFLRDKIFTYQFGAGEVLDVYYSAFILPDFILAILVTSSVGVAFIPIFTRLKKQSSLQADLYTKDILFWLLSVVIIICLIIAIALPWMVNWLVPGFTIEQQATYILFGRIMLFSPIIFALSNVFGGVLISTKDFFFYGIAPVFYNGGIIFGTLILVPQIGLVGLAWGTVIGAMGHLMIRLVVYRRRATFHFQRPHFSKEIKETIFLMLPKIFQLMTWQVLLFWFTRLASNLDSGSITIYNIARNFQSMPVSLIGIAIALSAFSNLNHLRAEKKNVDFKKIFRAKSFLILILTSGAAIFLAIVSYWLIKFLFGGGAFTGEAVHLTAGLLMVYTISIPLESWMHLLARTHYALGNTIIPAGINIFSLILTILISWFLISLIGIFAIPVSFAIGLIIQDLLLLISYQILSKRVFKIR
jgi:putative peptidoglycan lipid II flippase